MIPRNMGRPSQVLVRTLSILSVKTSFFSLFYQHFLDDLIDKIVFLIDNLLFTSYGPEYPDPVNRTLFQNFLVSSSNLMASPTGIPELRILIRGTSRSWSILFSISSLYTIVYSDGDDGDGDDGNAGVCAVCERPRSGIPADE